MVGGGHVVGCGDMWQGGHSVWGHVAGVGVFGGGSGLWHGLGHVVGVGACGRVWGHVAGVWGHVAHPATCPHTLPHVPIYVG